MTQVPLQVAHMIGQNASAPLLSLSAPLIGPSASSVPLISQSAYFAPGLERICTHLCKCVCTLTHTHTVIVSHIYYKFHDHEFDLQQ